jgi:hypothetical protein
MYDYDLINEVFHLDALFQVIPLLILSVGLGLAVAAIAKHRGRSPAGWFVLGLLVFPIALPLLFLVAARPRPGLTGHRRS